MKQTVEEKEKKYSNDCRNRQLHCEPYCIVDFIAGAEWQSKQSPWISVEERLPEESGYYFITDGAVVEKVYFFKKWNKFAELGLCQPKYGLQ